MKKYALIFVLSVSLYPYWKSEYMVEMRDGVKLHTNVYLPQPLTGSYPVILIRTPYGADNFDSYPPVISYIVDGKGYILVVQDTRGRFKSEGVDSVFLDDGWRDGKWDGYDTVEWIAEQSWCDGNVGTYGGSAMGITQYLLAGTHPEALKCCFVVVAPWSMYHDCVFPGGEYREYDVDGWLSGQGSMYMKDYYLNFHPNYDEEWMNLDLSTRPESVNVPIYHVSGWYDFFNPGQIKGFIDLQYRGGNGAIGTQKLIMGPWTHGTIGKREVGELTYPENAVVLFDTIYFRWFDHYLKGIDNGIEEVSPVKFYLMGPVDMTGDWNKWVEMDTFPPQTYPLPLYLGDGKLYTPDELENLEMGEDTIVYDPHDPVPTIGGNNLILDAGPYDWTQNLSREDVILYEREVEEDIEFVGDVYLYLEVSSDRTDTDITAFLIDGYPDGRNMLITDGILRLRHRNTYENDELLIPGEKYRVKVYLGTTAYHIPAGHTLILAVSSSNYPRFMRNTNTGEPKGLEHDTLVATNILYRGDNSYLMLPSTKDYGWGVEIAHKEVRHQRVMLVKDMRGLKGEFYTITGRKIENRETLPSGIYLMREGDEWIKIIKTE